MANPLRVIEELRRRLYDGDQQAVTCAAAGDLEEVALGVVDLLQSASSPTVSMRSCKGMTSSSQAITTTARNSPLAQVHRSDRRTARRGLDVIVEGLKGQSLRPSGWFGPDTGRRPVEHRDGIVPNLRIPIHVRYVRYEQSICLHPAGRSNGPATVAAAVSSNRLAALTTPTDGGKTSYARKPFRLVISSRNLDQPCRNTI